jgi:hypothetical protein
LALPAICDIFFTDPPLAIITMPPLGDLGMRPLGIPAGILGGALGDIFFMVSLS